MLKFEAGVKKFQGRSPMKMTSVSHRALALLLFATPLTLALTPGSGAPPGSAPVVCSAR